MNKRMNLFTLTWPIFIENVLFMLLGFIDIFVLSRYNDVAASAVSAANQIISICNLVFSIISGATAILISQSLGAQKRQSASQIAALSLLFSTVIGLVISALIALFHRPLLAALGAQGEILEYGCEYLLIVGGFIIILAERHEKEARVHSMEEMSWKDALKVGFAQAVAMIPGTSRSGATIIGGMLFGLSRQTATQFSFFLAIPTMFAATVYDLYKNRELLVMDDLALFGVGFFAAFIAALLTVKALLSFVTRHSFVPFAYYRIVFGVLVLASWYFGWVDWSTPA